MPKQQSGQNRGALSFALSLCRYPHIVLTHTMNVEELNMAWLELERSGVYHIAFRLGDRKFKKSLRTKSEIEAEARRHRLEENLRLVESGRLSIPQDCDASVFLMSDGKLNESPKVAKSLSLGALCELSGFDPGWRP